MSYSEALEKQAEALRHVERAGADTSRHEEEQIDCRKVLNLATTYYLDRTLLGVLRVASAGLLDYTLRSNAMLSPAGFIWLDGGIESDSLFADHEHGIVLAIAWGWFKDNHGHFLKCWAFANHTLTGTPFLEEYFDWSEGTSIRDWFGEHVDDKSNHKTDHHTDHLGLIQLLACFWQFCQQELITTVPQEVERPARKRLTRAGWVRKPVVRTVMLRRLRSGQRTTTSHAVDWSCQWLVGGHWRQHFYPSKGGHRPIWITPYVKGPKDKPLKPPGATVFAVVR